MVTSLEMNPKRKRLEIARRLAMGFTFAALLEGVILLIREMEHEPIGYDAAIFAVTITVALTFYTYYQFKTTVGAKQLHARIKEWVFERYGLELNPQQVRVLATPSKIPVRDVLGYCSDKLLIWKKGEFDKNEPVAVRLLEAGDDWALFCTDLGEEYPLKAAEEMKEEEKEFFHTMWEEVKVAGGFYSLSKTGGEGFISGVAQGSKPVVLFWSDALRAELWGNSQTDEKWEPVFVPLPAFKHAVLAQIQRDQYMVGLNWDDKRRFFKPEFLQDLIKV